MELQQLSRLFQRFLFALSQDYTAGKAMQVSTGTATEGCLRAITLTLPLFITQQTFKGV